VQDRSAAECADKPQRACWSTRRSQVPEHQPSSAGTACGRRKRSLRPTVRSTHAPPARHHVSCRYASQVGLTFARLIFVELCRALLELGFVTYFGSPCMYPGPLSLSIPPFLGAFIVVLACFGHRWGRNGEFCVAVGHVNWTTGIRFSKVLAVKLSQPSSRYGLYRVCYLHWV